MDGVTTYKKTRMWSSTNNCRILTNENEVNTVPYPEPHPLGKIAKKRSEEVRFC